MIATNGTESVKVHITHWWPHRYYSGGNIPSYIRARALQDKTRYLTMANVDMENGIVAAFARCKKTDAPNRATGRELALSRLSVLLAPLGWRLVEA